MGRLIDAGLVLDNLSGRLENMKDYDVVKDVINNMSTAYDPDKVVAQLEEVEKIMTSPVNNDCFGEECRASDCTVCLISKAIEIVKGGGADGN
nr:MAG TPA: hypothetical protein [Caudoviricetes sp.]